MDYDEMLHAALPKMPGYDGLSDAAKELLGRFGVLDLKNEAECRARLEPYQQEKGFDDITLWGTVVVATRELWSAGFFKKGGVVLEEKLFIGLWSDEVKEAALKEAGQ